MEIRERDAIRRVEKLMGIPGPSGQESKVAEAVIQQLKQAGVPDNAITFDDANKRSPIGGEIGNLIVKLPGTVRAPRRLLMAHLDTVPLCVGCKPVRVKDEFKSKDRATALGADNRSGTAVALTAILEVLRQNLPHPPLTLLLTVQEEIGLVGARNLRASKLGKPKLCFNWDGGDPESIIIGATGADYLDIQIEGIASHAGAHPEDGVNAAAVASLAIAQLVENGWHGKVEKGRQAGTANLGMVHGGKATNVVMDEMHIEAEVRSHNPKFRARLVREYQKAFESAAKKLRNAAGKQAKVRFEATMKYESFALAPKEAVVDVASDAVRNCGLEPFTRSCDGGLDANWLSAHGYPAVTLGCGQSGIHTVEERLSIPDYLAACRIGLCLASTTS